MAEKKVRKQTEKVYRSIAEYKEHFFPNSYEKEIAEKKSQDPKEFGAGLVQELLENVRREFRS